MRKKEAKLIVVNECMKRKKERKRNEMRLWNRQLSINLSWCPGSYKKVKGDKSWSSEWKHVIVITWVSYGDCRLQIGECRSERMDELNW